MLKDERATLNKSKTNGGKVYPGLFIKSKNSTLASATYQSRLFKNVNDNFSGVASEKA